ncbi:hypothetical protein GWI33_014057 [Rhynchophorus ferrugineus]|uniref:Uncharacterized protein n=1 Tax=Rhynchophorus ferrugineus TaxID=354439 RepID=A0A834I3D6_RHYFE|nr:hypothetical protein GWI33_014057 [Rhynchophorus ferrugineus]
MCMIVLVSKSTEEQKEMIFPSAIALMPINTSTSSRGPAHQRQNRPNVPAVPTHPEDESLTSDYDCEKNKEKKTQEKEKTLTIGRHPRPGKHNVSMAFWGNKTRKVKPARQKARAPIKTTAAG